MTTIRRMKVTLTKATKKMKAVTSTRMRAARDAALNTTMTVEFTNAPTVSRLT